MVLMFWLLDGSTETVQENDILFMVNSRIENIWLYINDEGLFQFMGIDNMGQPINFYVSKKTACIERLITYIVRPNDLQY
jgi:hypothetical protein